MKMDDAQLLDILQRHEDAASDYVNGELGRARIAAMREYHRMPYGNEVDGESQIVSSDIQDSIEWILPSLIKTFTSTDKAVSFEPETAADVIPAEQATDACNYVFFRQNNGLLILYTAIKDMLTVRNCAVMWRKEDKMTVSSSPFKDATEDMMAMLTQDENIEVETANAEEVQLPDGTVTTVWSGRLKKTEKKTIVKVESFSPDCLLVARDWTTPLLQDCPYVCRMMRVTLTDLKMMGFKGVEAEDLRSSDAADYTETDKLSSVDRLTTARDDSFNSDDDSMADGWLRIEYVLADKDDDGIAERLCVYRLRDKILKYEVVSHVPIATASPILNPHRWDGSSITDMVSDLQKLHTELLRETLNNLYLSNRPRTKVLTDSNGAPMANIDDLLDSRVGGIIRQRDVNAITEQVVPFTAGASMPMMEYVQTMRENRTGVSRQSMGLNPDALNNTATGKMIDQSSSMQRIELIARIIAETLIKPIFQGILKVLTDGEMEKICFKLRDDFVEYDPNEWRDWYNMTINVGLGTGDSQAKSMQLMNIIALQKEGLALGLVTPKHLYNSAARLVENAGFKDVQNFLQDPTTVAPQPPQMPIPVQIEQMKLQAEQQNIQTQTQADIAKFQAESQQMMQLESAKLDAKLKEIQANLELQASNDQRDSDRELHKAQQDAQLAEQKIEFEKWNAELQAQTQIYIEQLKLGSQQPVDNTGDLHNALAMSIDGFKAALEQMNRPKQIVRDQTGRAQGII